VPPVLSTITGKKERRTKTKPINPIITPCKAFLNIKFTKLKLYLKTIMFTIEKLNRSTSKISIEEALLVRLSYLDYLQI
jgi:hypothetical protein